MALVILIVFSLDYILTYIGVNHNIITEANPLMAWMFELPFLYGLTIRILIGTVISIMLWLGRNTKLINFGYKIIIAANSAVFTLHLIWIWLYIISYK